MQAFIDMATQQLGIDQSAAQQATGGLLSVAQQQLESGDFSQLLSQLPGAESFFSEFTSGGTTEVASSSGGLGGLLGGLAGAFGGGGSNPLGSIASVLGGNADLGAAATALLGSGLSGSQLGGLADMFLDYVKANADDILGEQIAGFLPQLTKLAA